MGYSVSTLQMSKMWKLCCLQAKPVQKDAFLKIPSLYFFCWTCCGTVVPAWCASSSCCRTQQCLSSNHSIPDRARDQLRQSMRREEAACGPTCCLVSATFVA